MDLAIKMDQPSARTSPAKRLQREIRRCEPLRILGVDPELGFAGGETQVLGLTLGLLRSGHRRGTRVRSARTALRARATRGHRVPSALDSQRARLSRPGCACGICFRATRYDVVHFHTSRAHSMAPFARGHARALVVTRRMDYRPNRLFAPYLYNRAVDAVAAISSKVADALGEAGVSRDHLRIIPSGVDCDHFRPADSSEREACAHSARYRARRFPGGHGRDARGAQGSSVFAGSDRDAKSHARTDASRIKCAIAGDGAMRDELAKLARESGIASDTLFLGMIGDSRQLLDALDVFVFPSLKEGLGVALLEAMACGLPVVASRAGGVVDIVEDQSQRAPGAAARRRVDRRRDRDSCERCDAARALGSAARMSGQPRISRWMQ